MATLTNPVLPSHVNIVEVGPRDGLQNEKQRRHVTQSEPNQSTDSRWTNTY